MAYTPIKIGTSSSSSAVTRDNLYAIIASSGSTISETSMSSIISSSSNIFYSTDDEYDTNDGYYFVMYTEPGSDWGLSHFKYSVDGITLSDPIYCGTQRASGVTVNVTPLELAAFYYVSSGETNPSGLSYRLFHKNSLVQKYYGSGPISTGLVFSEFYDDESTDWIGDRAFARNTIISSNESIITSDSPLATNGTLVASSYNSIISSPAQYSTIISSNNSEIIGGLSSFSVVLSSNNASNYGAHNSFLSTSACSISQYYIDEPDHNSIISSLNSHQRGKFSSIISSSLCTGQTIGLYSGYAGTTIISSYNSYVNENANISGLFASRDSNINMNFVGIGCNLIQSSISCSLDDIGSYSNNATSIHSSEGSRISSSSGATILACNDGSVNLSRRSGILTSNNVIISSSTYSSAISSINSVINNGYSSSFVASDSCLIGAGVNYASIISSISSTAQTNRNISIISSEYCKSEGTLGSIMSSSGVTVQDGTTGISVISCSGGTSYEEPYTLYTNQIDIARMIRLHELPALPPAYAGGICFYNGRLRGCVNGVDWLEISLV